MLCVVVLVVGVNCYVSPATIRHAAIHYWVRSTLKGAQFLR